ncbi:MAG: hypothetical protein WC900_04995 [Oscillospiraceae bacterium]
MNKRIIALFVAGLTVISFAACSKDKEKKDSSEASSHVTTTTEASKPDSSEIEVVPFDELSDDELYELADTLYQNALNYAEKYEVGGFPVTEGTYEDENGMFWAEVDPTRYTSYNDLKAELDSVFSSAITDGYLSQFRYVENNGKIYTFEGNRGADISYKGYEFTLIKEVAPDKITFEQTIHRKDFSTESEFTENADLTIIIENGEYKISSFVFPY